jgi:lysine 2,3-aminomutase
LATSSGSERSLVGRVELMRRFPSLPDDLWLRADRSFPVRATRSFLARVRDQGDALARQVLPSWAELEASTGDVDDPVGDGLRRPVPFVVQKHPDRALLLVTHRCHLYCRYCFRRDQVGEGEPSRAEIDLAINWLHSAGLKEVILSGGDPLILSDRRLFAILDALRGAAPVIRIHSRAPITEPARVTPALVRGLRDRAPIWVIVHANHPDELAPDVVAALARLVDGGVPTLNQSVLLRGVNDDVDVLAALSERLVSLRVFPYYLHHTDPVPGNAAFRVSLDRGLKLHAALSRRVSGLGLPRYVVDPPDGSGKIDARAWAALTSTSFGSP